MELLRSHQYDFLLTCEKMSDVISIDRRDSRLFIGHSSLSNQSMAGKFVYWSVHCRLFLEKKGQTAAAVRHRHHFGRVLHRLLPGTSKPSKTR